MLKKDPQYIYHNFLENDELSKKGLFPKWNLTWINQCLRQIEEIMKTSDENGPF